MSTEYRVVKKFSGFFSHWYYILEKKVVRKWFWLFPYEAWEQVAGNKMTQYQPDEWDDFNIIETITEQP